MKIKALRKIKKKWDYTFCKGKLIMRKKSDFSVVEYNSIEQFMINFIYDNIGFSVGQAYIRSKRKIEDKKKWELAKNCNG